MFDVLIIGAGIIGSFLAHDLSKKELKVLVIEKESDVANRATMANSAIIHSGHDPLEGTLKARLNVRGNEMYESICNELNIKYKKTSAFVVATSAKEEVILDKLYTQAKNRNIPVHYLKREEAIEKEPNLSDYVTKVIELPSTGIVYPWEVAIALAEEAILNGVEFHLTEEVQKIEKSGNIFEVYTDHTRYESEIVINAAGTYSDRIYGMVSNEVNFKIMPRKGEYFVLDKSQNPIVSRVIYPVPSTAGKGVLVVPTIHGNILLGPNSEIVDSDESNNNTKDKLDYIKKEIEKTVKNVPMQNVIRTFAGLRPTSTNHDFIIEEAKDVENFINIAGIESPGLASAPAISEYVMNELLTNKINRKNKEEYIKRKPVLNPKELSDQERNELVKREPAYGRIVCRCEQITEGEILDVIRRPLGAKTVKGVKKRIRPGTGRCQGGFCEPLVIDILARELHISPMEVRLDSENSVMLVEETKG